MKGKGVTILLFFIACTLQEIIAQSLDSLPYTLTVEEDILGMDIESEQDKDQLIQILSKGSNPRQAALSNTLITQEEIVMSGATCLLEVLRLSPEVFIRESTSGNYTVQFRGSSLTDRMLDNRNAILLMIDEVPFYDFLEQTTWWETIPVAVQDIKQVEIVRFSHAAWYGPEAVDGAINIVTRSDNGSGFRTQVYSQVGSRGNYAHQGSISISQGKQFSTRVSAFYNQRPRFQNTYYIFGLDKYVSSDSLLFYQVNAESTNPSARNSLKNSGIHVSADYWWNASKGFQISGGTQASEAQGIFRRIEQIALTDRLSNTNWLSFQSRWKPFKLYASYEAGLRSYVGYEGYRPDYMQQLRGKIEYNQQWKKYQIGLSAEALSYEYANSSNDTTAEYPSGLYFASPSGQRYSMNLFQHFSLIEDRIEISIVSRGDYYKETQQLLTNHQLSTSYRLHSSHKINAAVSYGNRPPSVLAYHTPDSTVVDNRPLLTTLSYEASFRSQITKNVRSELTLFDIRPVENVSGEAVNLSHYRRSGVTGLLNWQINRLYLSGFVTGMHYSLDKDIEPVSTSPSLYGGFTGRYTALFGKLQAQTSVYYYGRYGFVSEEQSYPISAKVTLSGRLSYRIWEEHSLFFSSQNLLDNRKVESPFGDQTRGIYWIGMNLRF